MTALLRDRIPANSCLDAKTWLGKRTAPDRAWKQCGRADWMLWLMEVRQVDHKILVAASTDCVRMVLRHVPEGDARSLAESQVKVVEAWQRGEASLKELLTTRDRTEELWNKSILKAPLTATEAISVCVMLGDLVEGNEDAYEVVASVGEVFGVAASRLLFWKGSPSEGARVGEAAYLGTLAECARIVRKHYPNCPPLEGG